MKFFQSYQHLAAIMLAMMTYSLVSALAVTAAFSPWIGLIMEPDANEELLAVIWRSWSLPSIFILSSVFFTSLSTLCFLLETGKEAVRKVGELRARKSD